MPSQEALLDILTRWNPWGRAQLRPGYPRNVLQRLERSLDGPRIITLIGPRRAGKTTVMFQLMEILCRDAPVEAVLHLNLEEPALAPELGTDLLENLYRTWRREVYPSGRGFLFLDEIQRVPGWERWVRARNESEDIKIVVTGSSAELMSRELATLLTGRHLTFRIHPLDFSEFLRFRGIEPPVRPRLAGSPPEIEHALSEYLRWGGYPEVVLAADEEQKREILKQSFDDVLFKDVALRHEVRDVAALRRLAVHLLSQTASLVSWKRLAAVFGVSLDLMRRYCNHLEEAFLLGFIEHYSLKTAERLRRPRKVHALDAGLRNAVSLSGSPDHGRLMESVVYQALARLPHDELCYWHGKGEVDLLLRQENRVAQVVQVAHGGLDEPKLREREISALLEAKRAFPDARATLIVTQAPAEAVSGEIEVLPLWRFLLNGNG